MCSHRYVHIHYIRTYNLHTHPYTHTELFTAKISNYKDFQSFSRRKNRCQRKYLNKSWKKVEIKNRKKMKEIIFRKLWNGQWRRTSHWTMKKSFVSDKASIKKDFCLGVQFFGSELLKRIRLIRRVKRTQFINKCKEGFLFIPKWNIFCYIFLLWGLFYERKTMIY